MYPELTTLLKKQLMDKDLAPVVLFAYNRPQHLNRTLTALKENDLAKGSELFIYCDGLKSHTNRTEFDLVQETRRVAEKDQWCGKVNLIFRDKNLGLAENITSGVTEVVSKYGKVIVLEDDVETSTHFLSFMNRALELYSDEESVMHISGYWFPVKPRYNYFLRDYFFYQSSTCWGWATWSRAWKFYTNDSRKLKSQLYHAGLWSKFTFNHESNFGEQLDKNISGEISTWAVKWQGVLYLRDGLALHPKKSYTRNIGNDSSGVHSGTNAIFDWKNLNDKALIGKVPVKKSWLASKAYRSFYRQYFIKRSLLDSLKVSAKAILRRLIKPGDQWLEGVKKLPRYIHHQVDLPEMQSFRIVDSSSFYFMYKEIFQEGIYQFIAKDKNPTIIDCGANVGVSVLYFKSLYPEAKVIAFEPDPEVYEVLMHNTSRFQNVKLINKGVYDKNGYVAFNKEGTDAGKVDEDADDQIEVTTLSSYIDEPIAFLKMDIEGAEYIVLKEIETHLYNVENMFIEYHSFLGQEQFLAEILDIIKKAGFRVYISTPGLTNRKPFIRRSHYLGMDMQLNISCLR